MAIESGENPANLEPDRVHPSLGLSLIVLSFTRGWQDTSKLVSYMYHNGVRLLFSPSTVPWEEFSGIACSVWPLMLGLVLIRSRSTSLLKAAAITGIALGFERGISLLVGVLFDSGWRTLYRGSWDPTRGPVGPRGVALVLAIGTVIGWLVVGGWAWRLAVLARANDPTSQPAPDRGRRRAKPRYVNIAATLFAVGILMMTSWFTYLTVLERLPWVRNMVLGGDRPRQSPFIALDTPQGRRFRDADRFLAEGQGHQSNGRFLEARQAYVKATNRYEALMEDFPKARMFRRQFAFAANNLAWFLSTCPEQEVREPEVAVMLAKKAMAINPNDGNTLNTLAVAQFRAGELEASRASFEKSMELRGGGDAYDWFFLAQIDAGQGKSDSAKSLYDKATEWTLANRPRDPELFRFQIETAERLKLPRPSMPASEPVKPPSGDGQVIFEPFPRRGFR